jgi:hypothetical protein
MNDTLKKLKDVQAECCITIILNTHRTKPDNKRDPIQLKNLLKEAEERLLNDYDKRFARSHVEKMNQLAEGIDHEYNLESLVLFVNEDTAEYVRLPIAVEDRVVIDHTFATRDLVRAVHQQEAYYILVLSRDEARLIEAANDKVVQEVGDPFPFGKKGLYSTSKLDMTMAQGSDNLIEEFFNRVDKAFHTVWEKNPLPVLVCTEERNFHHYLKVADKTHLVIGHLTMSRLDYKAHHIVPEGWPIVQKANKERNDQRLEELQSAVGAGKFLSAPGDIWKAIHEGRGQTLFVQRGYFQPAIINGDAIELVELSEANRPGVVDDIIDEMIEANMRFGGDIVFLSQDQLQDFQGLALITRY